MTDIVIDYCNSCYESVEFDKTGFPANDPRVLANQLEWLCTKCVCEATGRTLPE